MHILALYCKDQMSPDAQGLEVSTKAYIFERCFCETAVKLLFIA